MGKPIFNIEQFDSLDDYLRIISSRPVNSVFAKLDELSSEKKGTKEFAATKTYEESVEIINNGFKEGLEKLMNNGGERLTYRSCSSKALPQAGVVGFAPIVPNAIIGLPNSMISTKRIPIKTKVVSIWYDITASCGVHSDSIARAGQHLMELIMMLEQQGYRVELRVASSYCEKDSVAMSVVKIKTDRQPMNPLKLAYPLIHASFLRRQGFKWLETNPNITEDGYRWGYGHALFHHVTDMTTREYMKHHKVIADNCFYTDYYEAEKYSAKELMERMGLR